MRLFCLPFAGAGASSFAPLSRRLGDTVEVCAVQLPGRESMQERCIGSVEALVAALEFSMRELMDCPYAILGYSMGQASPWNYVAGFAAASCLSPSHCLSSARPALACRRGPDRGPPHEQFVEELRRLGGTSQAILENSELLDIFLPVLRADFALSESYDYRVQEPLSLPTFAYAGESDALAPSVCRALVRRSRWPFRMRRFAGGHFFVQSSLEAVADSILRDLERWLVSPPSEVESSGT